MKISANTITFLTALAAAIGYGGWAVFANFEHGMHAWMMAGVIQGAYAFVSTLSITHIARWVFLKCNCAIKGIITGFIASFIVMLALNNFARAYLGKHISDGVFGVSRFQITYRASARRKEKCNEINSPREYSCKRFTTYKDDTS